MGWWVVLAVVAVAAARGHVWLAGGYFAGGLAVCYLVSLLRHPRRACRSCGGTGRHKGAMFWWGDRACTACSGGSRHRRWGVQLLLGDPGQRAWAEKAAGEAKSRRGAPR